MKRSVLLLAALCSSCSESHGVPAPICTTFMAGSVTEWWIHHSAPDGTCVYAKVMDRREASDSLFLDSLDQTGPYGVGVFVRADAPCDPELILPPVGNSRVARGWVRSGEVDGQPDVAMDVVIDFPAYPEEGTPAVSYHVQISGTEPTPRGRCAR